MVVYIDVHWTLALTLDELKNVYISLFIDVHLKDRCWALLIFEQLLEDLAVDDASKLFVPAAEVTEPTAIVNTTSEQLLLCRFDDHLNKMHMQMA